MADPVHTYASPGTYTVTLTATGICGDSVFVKEVQAWTTSVSGDLEEADVLLYPNPNQGSYFLKIENSKGEAVEISLADLQGRILNRQSFTLNSDQEELSFNFSELSSGMYLMQVQMKEGSARVKLVVE